MRHLTSRASMLVAVLLMVLFTAPTWATGKPPQPDPQPQNQHQGQEQGQGQAQGQQQGQGQHQSANNDQHQGQQQEASAEAAATATNQGNRQSVTYNETFRDVRQAPGVAVDAGDTTLACTRGTGAGISSPVGGLSFSFGKKDKDCFLLQAAQYELEQGNTVASVKLRCQITYYRKTLGDACIAYLEQKPSLPSVPEGGYVTREELDKLIKKGLVK